MKTKVLKNNKQLKKSIIKMTTSLVILSIFIPIINDYNFRITVKLLEHSLHAKEANFFNSSHTDNLNFANYIYATGDKNNEDLIEVHKNYLEKAHKHRVWAIIDRYILVNDKFPDESLQKKWNAMTLKELEDIDDPTEFFKNDWRKKQRKINLILRITQYILYFFAILLHIQGLIGLNMFNKQVLSKNN